MHVNDYDYMKRKKLEKLKVTKAMASFLSDVSTRSILRLFQTQVYLPFMIHQSFFLFIILNNNFIK